MWHHYHGNAMCTIVPLRRVWEIREGQWTKWFHHFPYEEVEGQSFSLIFEEEKGLYAMLYVLPVLRSDHTLRWGQICGPDLFGPHM